MRSPRSTGGTVGQWVRILLSSVRCFIGPHEDHRTPGRPCATPGKECGGQAVRRWPPKRPSTNTWHPSTHLPVVVLDTGIR